MSMDELEQKEFALSQLEAVMRMSGYDNDDVFNVVRYELAALDTEEQWFYGAVTVEDYLDACRAFRRYLKQRIKNKVHG